MTVLQEGVKKLSETQLTLRLAVYIPFCLELILELFWVAIEIAAQVFERVELVVAQQHIDG